MTGKSNGWNEHKNLVLHEMKETKETLKNLFKICRGISKELTNFKGEVAKEVAQIKIDNAKEITALRVKNSVWSVLLSGLGGAIVLIGMLIAGRL